MLENPPRQITGNAQIQGTVAAKRAVNMETPNGNNDNIHSKSSTVENLALVFFVSILAHRVEPKDQS